MEKGESSSPSGSIQDVRAGSPHRIYSKSYPPQRATRREHDTSVDVKLTDLMDEDEARWMSTMESSRAATPIQSAKPATHADQAGSSSNMTPPLPAMHPHRHSPATSSLTQTQQPSDSSAGLTALPQRKKSLAASNFAQRVFQAGRADLLYNHTERIRLPWRFKKRTHGAIDITTLQQMQKHVVQRKLIAQVRALGETESWLDIGIGETVREYCQVIQDLEYMQKHATQGNKDDPFMITTRQPLEAQLLEESGLARQSPGARSARHIPAVPIRHLKRRSACFRLLRRLGIMFAVAVAVVVPFLVSLFAPGYLSRIVVACGCIAVFAVVAAAVSRSGQLLPSMVLTLVYAAALIVFVGTTPARYTG